MDYVYLVYILYIFFCLLFFFNLDLKFIFIFIEEKYNILQILKIFVAIRFYLICMGIFVLYQIPHMYMKYIVVFPFR